MIFPHLSPSSWPLLFKVRYRYGQYCYFEKNYIAKPHFPPYLTPAYLGSGTESESLTKFKFIKLCPCISSGGVWSSDDSKPLIMPHLQCGNEEPNAIAEFYAVGVPCVIKNCHEIALKSVETQVVM